MAKLLDDTQLRLYQQKSALMNSVLHNLEYKLEDRDMERFKNIIVVATAEAANEAALERAADLANNNQARLTVVEVIEKIPTNLKLFHNDLSPEILQANIVAEHEKRLAELIAPWSKNIDIQIKVLIGIPFLEIIREVIRNGRDLLVKAAGCDGLRAQVFGSDDMHLLRKCPCPVWLVHSKSPKAYRRILVAAAVDIYSSFLPQESETKHQLDLQILDLAGSLALSEFAELHIAHVWEAIGESSLRGGFMHKTEDEVVAYVEKVKQQHQQNLNELVAEFTNHLGNHACAYLKPKIHLLKGSPRKEIPLFADKIEADLVVMGTVVRTGIPGFLMGNTAETILSRIDCSILAVKPQGFVTPVTLEE